MSNRYSKQILVWRADLRNVQGHKVRTGKMVAQLAHASMAAILNAGKYHDNCWGDDFGRSEYFLLPLAELNEDGVDSLSCSALIDWLQGSFTKICVYVNSEEELLAVYESAKKAGIMTALIQDSGKTEFGGVPTHTAVAIGPAWSDELEPITGHLPLL